MRSPVSHRPVFGRIVYSQCWEDPEIAAEGLRLGPADDLVTLTSAGDNVLALALRKPRSITTIDFSPSQNALLELKLAALRHLPWRDYVGFLGARESRARVSTYRQLRSHLRDDARAVFDAQPQAIARGIIHAGRFQRYLSAFRTKVLPLVHRKRAVDQLGALDDRDARDAFYRDVWDNRRWRALFTVFFGRAVMARLGRDPAFFRYVEQKRIGEAFLDRARRALVATRLADNHFLQYALLGEYADLERGPLYLRESQFENLRAATQNLRIVQGDLESFLGTMATGAASAFYLSDLFEWVAPAHHIAMLRAIARVARPRARLVYWNLLVPRARPAELADRLEVHDDEARALHARDLAFVYDSFHVESIR